MRLLAVETSGTHGGIALMEGQETRAAPAGPPPRVIDEARLAEGLRHARDLIAAIRDACHRAAWDPRRIDLVAVSIGPGSFTGIRIAVTLAKFVAWNTGAKVVAVPTLRAMAENAPADRRRIVPILDAKRGGLFAGIFERREGPPAEVGADAEVPARPDVQADADFPARRDVRADAEVPARPDVQADADFRARRGSGGRLSDLDEIFGPALIEPEDLARRLQTPAFILGTGIPKGRAALAAFELAPEPLWDVRPAVVAHLGWQLHEEGRYADPLRLEPVYLRPPEAQEIWDRKHGK
jgi:tRNA threonylcarbamoyl adenosine modification protein YeaZ